MLASVREGLLDDPIRRQLNGRWQLAHVTLDADLHAETRIADRGDEPWELAEPGPWAHIVAIIGLAQEAKQLVQLIDSLPAGRFDGGERCTRRGWIARQHDACRAGLHAHHADVMSNDIVQLAGDPHALIEHRTTRALLTLKL